MNENLEELDAKMLDLEKKRKFPLEELNAKMLDLEKKRKLLWEERKIVKQLLSNQQLQERLGKYYRYKNCYSHPEAKEDYWYLYSTVLSVDAEGRFVLFSFEKDRDGKIVFYKEEFPYYIGHHFQEEISEEEFRKRYRAIMQEIQLPLVKFVNYDLKTTNCSVCGILLKDHTLEQSKKCGQKIDYQRR